MSKEQRFFLLSLALLLFSGSYLFTEILPAPLWWYYPLEQRWEFGIQTSPGLRMGWYGKILLSSLVALSFTGLVCMGLYLWRKTPALALRHWVNLATMSMIVFVLYYLARSLILAMKM